MGDRTYVSLIVHPEDMKTPAWQAFIDDLGESDEEIDTPGVWMQYEVNYAGYDALEHLAEAGARFQGDHGSGGDYEANCFFSDGDGAVHYCSTWSDHKVSVPVRITRDEVEVNYEALMHEVGLYMRYVQIGKAINEAWDGHTK